MISIILISVFFVLVGAMVGCETYAESFPNSKFSKWWRHNIIARED